MHAKLTEIIGINKVNINPRYPALNAIFIRLFLKIIHLFLTVPNKSPIPVPGFCGNFPFGRKALQMAILGNGFTI